MEPELDKLLGASIARTDDGKENDMRPRTLDPTKTGEEAEALEFGLRSKIIGQEDAIHQVVEMYQTYLSGMSSPGRPIANLMFLGPTGSGKTRLVEATAECLLQNAGAVIKIDCAEFQHGHEIAKLIGSPPGILDKATLTLGDNTKVDFSKAMIFMTSNVGAWEMSALTKPRLGFARLVENCEIGRSGIEAARRKFTPEFINRIDKMVVFRSLGANELNRILDIELNSVRQRVLKADDGPLFGFAVTAAGKQFLLNEGTNVEYGARHLKRAIERFVVQPLSRLIASGQILNGDFIEIDCGPQTSALTFSRQDEGLPVREMARFADLAALSQAAFATVA